jgi:hypothetical protein
MGDEQRREIVEQVRSELIRAALSAYEDAGMRGLCAEGAWEVAVSAMRSLDLSPALKSPSPPK